MSATLAQQLLSVSQPAFIYDASVRSDLYFEDHIKINQVMCSEAALIHSPVPNRRRIWASSITEAELC